MAFDSLLTSRPLQVIDRLVLEVDCQNLLLSTGLLQVVSTSCNKSANRTSCNKPD